MAARWATLQAAWNLQACMCGNKWTVTPEFIDKKAGCCGGVEINMLTRNVQSVLSLSALCLPCGDHAQHAGCTAVTHHRPWRWCIVM
jgi:hypothetical protein